MLCGKSFTCLTLHKQIAKERMVAEEQQPKSVLHVFSLFDSATVTSGSRVSSPLVRSRKVFPAGLLSWWTCILVMIMASSEATTSQSPPSSPALRLNHPDDQHVEMDNGILQVTISNPDGIVSGVRYNGIDNLLEVRNKEFNRGYWDLVWNFPGKVNKRTKGTLDRIRATKFEVIAQDEDRIELSFARIWNSSSGKEAVPLNVDKRFVMLRGSSGFYTYAVFERPEGWPAVEVDNIRIAFKLNQDKFHYMAISDTRKRYMPLPNDRTPPRGQPLAYPEAVLLVNPEEPQFRGEVDDKYQYSCESKDIKVHGWICTNQSVGFWQITPSNEFRSAGPVKQSLASHVGPTHLAIFHSTHYTGADLIIQFQDGEPWKKVFGPVFFYANSLPSELDPLLLWDEAKNRTIIERQKWPYDFVESKDFPPSSGRGNVSGRLLVRDRFECDKDIPASGAQVGLAPPGDVGSWQRECKGYQFWTIADANGHFFIENIRPGNYNINAFVPGFIGEFFNKTILQITAGSHTSMGELVFMPPRDGPTLWEIGVPDRTAAEFYVPDPYPTLVNKLYLNSEKYRQYGLWEKYSDLYPDNDLVYTVGVSNYSTDWFFAQVTRKQANKTYVGTTWRINFPLDDIDANGSYKLRIAIATANVAELQVRVNGVLSDPPLFTTGQIGRDNTIARHGVHRLYWLYSIGISGSLLSAGKNNTLMLTQPLAVSPFQGLMYDYIRLEGPVSNTSASIHHTSSS